MALILSLNFLRFGAPMRGTGGIATAGVVLMRGSAKVAGVGWMERVGKAAASASGSLILSPSLLAFEGAGLLSAES